jgi:hypothetical protein
MARTPVGAAVSGARARARRNMDSWGKEMASATAATTARPRRRIACVRILVRSCRERTMRAAAAAAAAATAASHRARDWCEQSYANGRRRHEHDAQSLCDHCRPRCGRQIQLPQPNGCVFVVVARRDCGSTAHQLQALITSTVVHFCLLGVRLNLSQCTMLGPGELAWPFTSMSKTESPKRVRLRAWGCNEAGGDLGDRGPPRTNVSTRQRHILRPNGIKVTGAA